MPESRCQRRTAFRIVFRNGRSLTWGELSESEDDFENENVEYTHCGGDTDDVVVDSAREARAIIAEMARLYDRAGMGDPFLFVERIVGWPD